MVYFLNLLLVWINVDCGEQINFEKMHFFYKMTKKCFFPFKDLVLKQFYCVSKSFIRLFVIISFICTAWFAYFEIMKAWKWLYPWYKINWIEKNDFAVWVRVSTILNNKKKQYYVQKISSFKTTTQCRNNCC